MGISERKEELRQQELDKTRPHKQTLSEKYTVKKPSPQKPDSNNSLSNSKNDSMNTSLDNKHDDLSDRVEASKEKHKEVTSKVKDMLKI